MENKEVTLKEIVKDTKRMAKFSHAIAGVLYYEVENEEHKFIFPVDMNDKNDVGTTTFSNEIKAITMMRYIRKAIENGDLVQTGKIDNTKEIKIKVKKDTRWVALDIVNNDVISEGGTPEEVTEEAEKITKNFLLMFVPKRGETHIF